MIERIKIFFRNYITKENKKIFLILFCLFLIEMIAFLRANVLYADDIGHTLYGYKDWHLLNRYVTSVLSFIFSCGNYMTDISPLSNIIASLLMAFSGLIIINLFDDKKKNISIIWKALAVTSIGIFPFFMQNLSYKVDMPYMALAIFLSIFPFLFYKYKKIFFICSVVCILGMLMTYQASSGIYPIIVMLLFYDNWLFKKEKMKKILIEVFFAAIAYLIACLIFKYFIMDISHAYRKFVIFKFNELILGIINNLVTNLVIIWNDLTLTWKILIGLLMLGFVIGCTNSSKQNKILSFISSILFIIICICLTFGIYLFLANPTFDARTYMSIGVLIGLISTYSLKLTSNSFIKIVVLFLDISFMTFVFQYVNILNKDIEYEDYIIDSIAYDISKLDCVKYGENIDIFISKENPYSPLVYESKNLLDDSQILKHLIPLAANKLSKWWAGQKLIYRNLFYVWLNEKDDVNKLDLYSYIDQYNYKIDVSKSCLHYDESTNNKKAIHVILKGGY